MYPKTARNRGSLSLSLPYPNLCPDQLKKQNIIFYTFRRSRVQAQRDSSCDQYEINDVDLKDKPKAFPASGILSKSQTASCDLIAFPPVAFNCNMFQSTGAINRLTPQLKAERPATSAATLGETTKTSPESGTAETTLVPEHIVLSWVQFQTLCSKSPYGQPYGLCKFP